MAQGFNKYVDTIFQIFHSKVEEHKQKIELDVLMNEEVLQHIYNAIIYGRQIMQIFRVTCANNVSKFTPFEVINFDVKYANISTHSGLAIYYPMLFSVYN